MKNAVVMKCLAEQTPVFNVTGFAESLKKYNVIKNTTERKLYNILGTLVEEKYLKRINESTYEKIIESRYPVLEFARDFILQCQDKNAVSEHRMGGLFWEMATVSLLGVPENLHMPEWKRKILDILLARMTMIFNSMEYLLTHNHSEPVHDAKYLRQTALEIIPYYLGSHLGEDNDGEEYYKLQNEIEGLIKTMAMHGYETSGMMNMISDIKYWSARPSANMESRKISEKFGMLFLPPRSVIDHDKAAEESIFSILKEMGAGMSEEKIVANLATHEEPQHVNSTLVKYKSYFEKEKIEKVIRLYEKIDLGIKVAPLLYSLDFHLKVLKGLEDKTLVEGHYCDGKYVGKEDDPDECVSSFVVEWMTYDVVLKSDEYHIPSEEFCENELSKIIDKLRPIIKKHGIRKLLQAASFQNKINLLDSKPFEPDKLDFEMILQQFGYQSHVKDIPDWLEKDRKEADDFVKNWISHE